MADKYMELVNTGLTKKLATMLGLPRPPRLRRYSPEAALLPGPVLILGTSAKAQELSDTLVSWGLDVRRHDAGEAKLGALVLLLDELERPTDLSPAKRWPRWPIPSAPPPCSWMSPRKMQRSRSWITRSAGMARWIW